MVALVRGNQLLVANAGDSRCVACHEGEAVAMTHDHKPTDAPEHARITKVPAEKLLIVHTCLLIK